MMYYCRDCGAVTEGYEEHECVLPEVVGEQPPCYIEYVTCSDCGSNNVEEAVQCPICSEWHEDITWSMLCPECLHEISSDFYDTFTNFREAYPDAKPRDILEGMADEFEKFYDEMFILIGKRQEEK